MDLETAELWSDEEVFERWKQLFCRSIPDETMTPVWRQRLSDISWFMRCLNETIARDANREDDCTGRFWEGRFKSQALIDEGALLACMTYVDLNPVRAGIAQTPEDSNFTSIHERIRIHSLNKHNSELTSDGAAAGSLKRIIEKETFSMNLVPLDGDSSATKPVLSAVHLPINYEEYLELLDWSGRAILADKRGSIPEHITPILTRMNVKQSGWISTVNHFQNHFFRAAGTVTGMKKIGDEWGAKWLKGGMMNIQVIQLI